MNGLLGFGLAWGLYLDRDQLPSRCTGSSRESDCGDSAGASDLKKPLRVETGGQTGHEFGTRRLKISVAFRTREFSSILV